MLEARVGGERKNIQKHAFLKRHKAFLHGFFFFIYHSYELMMLDFICLSVGELSCIPLIGNKVGIKMLVRLSLTLTFPG